MTVPVGADPPDEVTVAESTTDVLYTDGLTDEVRTVAVEYQVALPLPFTPNELLGKSEGLLEVLDMVVELDTLELFA